MIFPLIFINRNKVHIHRGITRLLLDTRESPSLKEDSTTLLYTKKYLNLNKDRITDLCYMLIVKRESNGGIKSCHIHGLLRDLAISKAKDSKNFEVYENIDYTSPISVRRLTIPHKKEIVHHINSSCLRSLIGFVGEDSLTSCLAPKLLSVRRRIVYETKYHTPKGIW